MSFEEKYIGKSIKSKMDNFEIVPPEDVWNNIEGVLLKNQAIVRRNKIIGAVVAVVLVSVLCLFFNFNKKNSVQKNVPENQPSPSSVNITDTAISTTGTSAQGGLHKRENIRQQNNSIDKIELIDEKNMDTAVQIEPATVKLNTDTIPQHTPPAEKVVVKKVIKKPVYIVQQDTIYKVDTLSKKKKW